ARGGRGGARAGRVAAARRGRHLDRQDAHVAAGQAGRVGAAARPAGDRPVGLDLPAAGAAPAPGRDLADLQPGPFQVRPLGGHAEVEPDRIGAHAGERADLQMDAGNGGVGHPLRDGRHDALGDPVLVHPAPPLGQCVISPSSAGTQQIRGSGSPTSRSTILVPPNAVLSRTMPGGSAVTWPMTAACSPSGCARSAARARLACWPSTIATSLPSQATYIGSMPSSSAAPRTWARTGI